jgi:2'-5' RNA ligase
VAEPAAPRATAGATVAATAFVVIVPEAQPRVDGLRQRFDPLVRLGVPAHVTVLHPFMLPQHITREVLARAEAALGGTPAFGFSLCKVARFPATAYLAPEPAEAFVALTEALVRAFPGFPPYGGEHATIVPHLTVAHGAADAAQRAAAELQRDMRRLGPIQARCRQLSLLENANGRWREMHRLPLPATPGA